MPVIRVDDEVYEALKARAIELSVVFGSPNDVLRHDYVESVNNKGKALNQTSTPEYIEIPLPKEYPLNYSIIPIPLANRDFFPGYGAEFNLETDVGVLVTHVTSAPKGTPVGDPQAGKYIAGNLKPWYERHQHLRDGAMLRIVALEPGKHYKLAISSN